MALINSSAINSELLYRSETSIEGPAGSFLAIGQKLVQTEATGNFLSIGQRVVIYCADASLNIGQVAGIKAVGNTLLFPQNIRLSYRAQAAAIFTIAQVNNATIADSPLLKFNQRIRPDYQNEKVPRFDLVLKINNYQIPASMIVDEITIRREEGQAAIMNVTLMPPKGLQDIASVDGKVITLHIDKDGQFTKLFTGRVNVPEIDLIQGKVRLSCSDMRRELLNAMPDPSQTIPNAEYSSIVFSEASDQAAKYEDYLSTVSESLDFDADNNWSVTSWYATPIGDPNTIEVTNSDVYRRNPEVRIASRGRIKNDFTLTLKWQYQRLRKRKIPCRLDTGINYCNWDFAVKLPSRELLITAVSSGCYYPEDIYTSGLTGGTILCSNTRVTDPTGYTFNPTYGFSYVSATSTVLGVGIPNDSEYFVSANWNSVIRWAQNIEETASIRLYSQQSIDRYSSQIGSDREYGVEAEYDTSIWENNKDFRFSDDGLTESPNYDLYVDRKTEGSANADLNKAFKCSIAKTIVEILESHRDNTVTFETDIKPDLKLSNSIYLNASPVRALGKVTTIEHTIDVIDMDAKTEVTISVSKSKPTTPFTTTITTGDVFPDVSDNAGSPQQTRFFKSVAIPLDKEDDGSYRGYVYKTLAMNGSIPDRVPYALIIDLPEVEAEFRDTRKRKKETAYDIYVPDELLEITFLEDY